MQAINLAARYDVRVRDLLAVASFVGTGHYLLSLLSNYHSAITISGIADSADVGITGAFGTLVYCAYRCFRPRQAEV
jgi:hypothetical protein